MQYAIVDQVREEVSRVADALADVNATRLGPNAGPRKINQVG
jgi:hypothetical protein